MKTNIPEFSKFAFDVAIEKAYKDDSGNMHVMGIASDTLPDRTRDKFSVGAVKSMARQAKTEQLPFLENHFCSVEMGTIVDSDCRELKGETQLIIDVELDPSFPEAVKLFKDVCSGKNKRQLSVGGKINLMDPDSIEMKDDKEYGYIRIIKKIDLDHVALTRGGFAANPRTSFVAAIVKSLDDAHYGVKDGGEGKENQEKVADGGIVKNEESIRIDDVMEKRYSGAGDSKLPERIKKLPVKLRNAFASSWNNSYSSCKKKGDRKGCKEDKCCEGMAFAIANSVVNNMSKKSFEALDEALDKVEDEGLREILDSINDDPRITELAEKDIIDENILTEIIEDILSKSVVPHKKYPVADKNASWSFSGADGNALLKSGGWGAYKAAHAYFDPSTDSAHKGTPEVKSAYKLPHHKIMDGGIKTVFRGVAAAGGALVGARGGTSIPSGDKKGIANHLMAHYKECGMTVPSGLEMMSKGLDEKWTNEERDLAVDKYCEEVSKASGIPMESLLADIGKFNQEENVDKSDLSPVKKMFMELKEMLQKNLGQKAEEKKEEAPATTTGTSNTATVTVFKADVTVEKKEEEDRDKTTKIEPMDAKSLIESFLSFLAKEKPEIAKSLGITADSNLDGIVTKAVHEKVDLKLGDVEKKTLEAIEKNGEIVQKDVQKVMGEVNTKVEEIVKRISELETATNGSQSLKDSEDADKKKDEKKDSESFTGVLRSALAAGRKASASK